MLHEIVIEYLEKIKKWLKTLLYDNKMQYHEVNW